MSPLGHSNAIQFWNSWVLLWNTSVPHSFIPFQTTASWGMQRVELFCQQRTKENSTVATFANIFTSLLTIIFCQKLFWFSSNGRYLQIFSYFLVKSFLVFLWWEIFANILIYLTIIFLSKVFWFSPGRVAELSQLIRCGRPQGHQPYSVGRFSRYWSSERSPQLFQIIYLKWKWQPWSLRRKFRQPRLEKSLEKCLKTLLFPCIWGVSEIILLLSVKPFPH